MRIRSHSKLLMIHPLDSDYHYLLICTQDHWENVASHSAMINIPGLEKCPILLKTAWKLFLNRELSGTNKFIRHAVRQADNDQEIEEIFVVRLLSFYLQCKNIYIGKQIFCICFIHNTNIRTISAIYKCRYSIDVHDIFDDVDDMAKYSHENTSIQNFGNDEKFEAPEMIPLITDAIIQKFKTLANSINLLL